MKKIIQNDEIYRITNAIESIVNGAIQAQEELNKQYEVWKKEDEARKVQVDKLKIERYNLTKELAKELGLTEFQRITEMHLVKNNLEVTIEDLEEEWKKNFRNQEVENEKTMKAQAKKLNKISNK